MDSLKKNTYEESKKNNFTIPKTKEATENIRQKNSQESNRLRTFSKKIMDMISGLPSKDITRKIALLALTTGVLHISAEKPAFGAELGNVMEIQPPASESVVSQQKIQTMEVHPSEYVRTQQKETFSRLFEDKEKVIPLIEKQGLILTPTSIETQKTIVYFNESKNGAYTLTALIWAVDQDTLELRVYNSDETIDLIRFKNGDIISAKTEKAQ